MYLVHLGTLSDVRGGRLMARFVIREGTPDEEDDYDEDFDELFDTLTGEVVFTDGGEPEDQLLCRDLSPLVAKLNEVAAGL